MELRLGEGSTRSSFHSTVNALEGILWREEHADQLPDDERGQLREMRARGVEYLLERGLLHRLSTGERVGDFVTELAHPARWPYSVLRGLDVVRRACELDGTAPDPRAAAAVDALLALRGPDGTWAAGVRHTGQEWFATDVPTGMPSPWLTLSALRVLRW